MAPIVLPGAFAQTPSTLHVAPQYQAAAGLHHTPARRRDND